MSNLPVKGSKARMIVETLYAFGGVMTMDALAEKHPEIKSGTVLSACRDYGLLTGVRGHYKIPNHLKCELDRSRKKITETEKGEIVPSRSTNIWDREWSGQMSATGCTVVRL